MEQKPVPVPHVLIFPLPAQGHVNSMLQLAELLCLSGLDHVTFLNTHHNHHNLLRFTDANSRFSSFPEFRFETISDGLPADHSRSPSLFIDLLYSMKTVVRPAFRELLISGGLKSDDRPPVTCVISDGILSFTNDVAKELGIPLISFRTSSACCLWSYMCVPKLIEAGEVPFREDADMDWPITCVPGMEHFLRRRDLPSFCRAKEVDDPALQLVVIETMNSTPASAHILNTFEDLEAPSLSQIRSHIPKLYTLGPLHALLNSRRKNYSPTAFSNSLREVDRSCMMWLDSQPPKSVVYVSFGSVVQITRNELLEFWYGLVNSGKSFLWVVRPDIVADKEGDSQIPTELLEGTMEKGCIVAWSPQEEVLVHPAVGGFLTHSGWNSTLESIVAGVPMLCWPYFADQQINSRFVSEVWNIGLDMKDTCDRSIVEKMVRDLMDDRREEFTRKTNEMVEKAKSSVREGGSSYCNLEELVHDIKSNNIRAP